MKSTMSQYFKGRPIPLGTKRRVRKAALARAIAKGMPVSGYSIGRLNRGKREVFSDAIFEIENEIESKGDGHPDDPTVVALRATRNEVYDDLGWNEYPKRKAG